MKSMLKARGFTTTLLLAIAAVLLPTLGHAQANQNFDAGTGTWDAGITQDWDGGTATWTADNQATFNSNTVNVSGTVDESGITFVGGSTTISGGTINQYNPGGYTFIQSFTGGAPNTNPVTISSQIVLGASGGDTQYFINNNSNNNMTIGNVDFAYTGADGRFQLSGNNSGGAITLNGVYTTSAPSGGSITFGNNGAGTYNLSSTANFTNFNTGLGGGQEGNSFGMIGDVLNIGTSLFNGQQTIGFYYPVAGNVVNVVGSQNITLNIYNSMKNYISPGQGFPDDGDGVSDNGKMTFNQGTANSSTWSGAVNQNGGNVVLGAVAGGRLNWAADLGSSTPLGLTVNPAAGGVVVISSNNNTYDLRDGNGVHHAGYTTAANLVSGTTLITNTSGSAFGNNAGLVRVQAGATLGGTGISSETVVAVAGTSIIAPGDPGQAGLSIAPSIGTLHLNGGLQVASGVTLAFKINGNSGFAGTNNDLLDFGPGDFAPVGNLTFDFTNLGTIQTSQPGSPNFYKIMQGGGAFDDSGITGYTFNAPAGYVVARYNFDSFAGTFSVDFQIVPEPSTYALMLGGLALLGFCVRRKNRA
jgi:hypothetical protein